MFSKFKGGIHPHDGKRYSKDKPLKELRPEGGDFVFLLSQHIGAPAAPIVEVGDRVLRGQKIAEAGGFVSAPIYSSISGTVKEIAPHLTATGGRVKAITITNDGQYEEVAYPEMKPYQEMTKEEIINAIGEAGVVGMGGAGFPTRVKLSPKEPGKIEYFIANCAECEPYITSDYRRMIENADMLVEGMKVALRLFDNAKGYFAVEDNKMDCVKILEDLTKDEPRIEVVPLKAKYPQGGERMLIKAVSGRSINSSMLPADAGCVVNNVETIINIYKAVVKGIPTMERTFTVSGDDAKEPGNFLVPIGMSQMEIVNVTGGVIEDPDKMVSGGPMMGFAMISADVPVTKTSSAILLIKKDVVAKKREASPCINCGRCVSACPERLVPSRLSRYAERKDEEHFVKFNGMECIECGCCTYVCPAKRQLKQAISSMRKITLNNRRKA